MTIFVSHSSTDAEPVRTLVANLQAGGNQVWLDQDLTGGESWWSSILNQIRGCSVFVFAMSENSLQSEACALELTYARDLGLPILPVQIADLRGFRDHAIFTFQAIDYRNPTASAGIALMRAIREREQERQPLPDPLPSPPPPPYEYLLLLGTAIHGREAISPSDQEAIVKQLRQALREERDEGIRTNVRTLLTELRARPEVTHRTVTEINELIGAAETAARQSGNGSVRPDYTPPGGQQAPRQQFIAAPYPSQQAPQQPVPGQPYWDGQRWVQPGGAVGTSQNQAGNTSKAFSITAFVLTGVALVVPLIGLGGIGLGVAAAVRKEKLGIAALVTAAAVTLLAWIFWSLIYSR